jgi:hypothetical protein
MIFIVFLLAVPHFLNVAATIRHNHVSWCTDERIYWAQKVRMSFKHPAHAEINKGMLKIIHSIDKSAN